MVFFHFAVLSSEGHPVTSLSRSVVFY